VKDKRMKFKKKGYFSIIREGVYEDERLGAYEVLGFGVVASFGETCWASYTTISKRMRCSRRQAIRVVQKLMECGYITKESNEEGNIFTVYDYPVTESHLVTESLQLVTESHPSSDSPSPKVDKLNRESKQITKAVENGAEHSFKTLGKHIDNVISDSEEERLYKIYPSRSRGRKVIKKSREDIKTIKTLLKEGYPVERAFREVALLDDYPKDLCRFLMPKNLPDMEEVGKDPGRPDQTPRGDDIHCHHEMDWSKAQNMGFNNYKGPCIHCNAGIMRLKEGGF